MKIVFKFSSDRAQAKSVQARVSSKCASVSAITLRLRIYLYIFEYAVQIGDLFLLLIGMASDTFHEDII